MFGVYIGEGNLAGTAVLLCSALVLYLRDGTGSYSGEAQDAFQLFFTKLLCWIAILFCALLALISVQIVRVGLSALGLVRVLT